MHLVFLRYIRNARVQNQIKQFGFSIIEVMVAISILGVGTYFITDLLRQGGLGQKTLLAQDDARVLTENMASMLSDPLACAATFNGLNPVTGAALNILKDKSGNPQYTTTQVYGNRGVQLSGLNIGGNGNDPRTGIPRWLPGSVPNSGTAFVQVDWLQTGSHGNQGIGPQHLYRYFMVYVTNIDAANKIVGCTATIGGASGIGSGTPNFLPVWNTASTLGTSTIYQDASGNLGIGTTTPTSPLQVVISTPAVPIPGGFSNADLLNIDGGSGDKIHISDNPAEGIHIWAPNKFSFKMFDGTLNHFTTLLTNGNVGIGTQTPATSLDVAGGIRPGSAGVTTGNACTPEGTFAYDMAAHAPVYCSNAGTWASMSGGGTTITSGYGIIAHWDGVPHSNNYSCPPGFTLVTQHMEFGNSNNANIFVCTKN